MPYADINGVKLYYREQGAGIPLLLLHPPLLTSANFRYQLEQLSDEFRVIAPDLRGHGRSGGSNSAFTYMLVAEDMRQLLNHLGIDRAIVCGYSTGGTLALEAMLAYPDRFIGGIVLSGMPVAGDTWLRTRIGTAVGLSGSRLAIRLLMLGITWGNADSIPTFRNLLTDAMRGDPRHIHEYYRFSLRYDCTDRLGQIAAPVLLLYGARDRGFARYRRLLLDRLPQAELVILSDGKHQLPTKFARQLGEEIRGWARRVIGGVDASVGAGVGVKVGVGVGAGAGIDGSADDGAGGLVGEVEQRSGSERSDVFDETGGI